MGAPVQESDDDKPSKSGPPKNMPKDVGAARSSHPTEGTATPWRRKRGRDVFEGDVAVVELRSRLALGTERIPEPVPSSTAPMFTGVLWLMSGIATAAAVAGVAGYLWGFKLSTSNRDFLDPPAAARAAPIGLPPIDRRGAANPVTSVDAAQRPTLLPTPPQTVLPPGARRPSSAEDTSLVVAKMKIGVELMTYGEVAAARVMFQRAAEAGDGAGAFALAETYDPLVLGGLRLREGITPDIALARTWYERARDLGSLEARDRISRLSQLPQ